LYGLDSNDSPLWLADLVEFLGARQAAINMSSLGDGRTSITILVLGDGESFSARSVAAAGSETLLVTSVLRSFCYSRFLLDGTSSFVLFLN
jgi:hypothetical protein